ncbi:WD repeat-containing protein 43 [Sesbania bispinosa]|nr:WD repeat-containing protein 43 [Sesbania bispinosa]
MAAQKAKKRQLTSDPHLPTTTNNLDFVTGVVPAMFACQLDLEQGEFADEILLNDDLSEPTIGEELADLGLLDVNKLKGDKEQDSSVPSKPPSADSVHVLLTQALNADDRTLLLDCLYTQDEKVITKSIA